MNNEELDRLIAKSMYSDTDVRSLDLRAGEADLMENVMISTNNPEQHQPLRPKPTRSRRPLFAGLAVGGALLFAGTAYAVSSLSSDRIEVVERANPCGLQAKNGTLVAAADDGSRQIEYWTFDSADSHADWVFTDAETGGGGGCGPQIRAEAHPIAPWAEYLLEVYPDESTYTLYGYAPGADRVKITFNAGVISAHVGSNGYFVTRSQLPTTANDTLERIDSYSNGEIIASQEPPFGLD
ncbi:MAG: hypothetical protein NTZ62_05160 [Actinobacteria bacterium]|nr:hypothetical protein [Actinomycetota bacterium]